MSVLPAVPDRSAGEGFGNPVRRKDGALVLVGAGCYSDDVNLPGQAYACFLRSPHAHARIGRIDTAAARATPGVIAVLTGADAAARTPARAGGVDGTQCGGLPSPARRFLCALCPWLLWLLGGTSDKGRFCLSG